MHLRSILSVQIGAHTTTAAWVVVHVGTHVGVGEVRGHTLAVVCTHGHTEGWSLPWALELFKLDSNIRTRG